jgi:GDPmannose 4,6-dehydratase
VVEDQRYYRPAETHPLVADPAPAYQKLGWRPEVDFETLIAMMVSADLADLQKGS